MLGARGGRMACKWRDWSEPLPLSELPSLGTGQEDKILKYLKNRVSHSSPVQTRKLGSVARHDLVQRSQVQRAE